MSIASNTTIRKAAQSLMRRNLVDFEKIEHAFQQQEETGRNFVRILVDEDLLGEKDAAMAIAEAHGLKFVDLEKEKVDAGLAGLLSQTVAISCMALPVRKQGATIMVAVATPEDKARTEKVRKAIGRNIDLLVSTPSAIQKAISRVYRGRADAAGGGETDAPAIEYVDQLFDDAISKRATDIHLEPGKESVSVRYRIDGILYPQDAPHHDLYPAIVSRIKIMGSMDIGERRLPQGGRIQRVSGGKEYDLRVSTFPTVHGEKVVIRVLAAEGMLLNLESLGFPSAEQRVFEELIRRPNGIILVTGPTGSGKSTTLYAALNTIKSTAINIHTLEDPVEYQMDLISQTQMNPKADLTFARALRDILRQDPDVVMVGEIRDVETAEVAINAALTGHLVFSTLHTNNASGAFTRLDNMEIEPFLVASSVIGVIAQRLVRRLCPECREPDEAARERIMRDNPGADPTNIVAYREVGCSRCHQTGFSGRTGIFELLVPDVDIQKKVIAQASAQEIEAMAVQKGMTTLWQSGMSLVCDGTTTLAEVMRVAH